MWTDLARSGAMWSDLERSGAIWKQTRAAEASRSKVEQRSGSGAIWSNQEADQGSQGIQKQTRADIWITNDLERSGTMWRNMGRSGMIRNDPKQSAATWSNLQQSGMTWIIWSNLEHLKAICGDLEQQDRSGATSTALHRSGATRSDLESFGK